jgi:hypothetical protein
MALPTNNDFANCELSTEEIDAIAAGFSFSGLIHDIEGGLKSFFTNKYVVGAGLTFVLIGGILTGGGSKTKLS